MKRLCWAGGLLLSLALIACWLAPIDSILAQSAVQVSLPTATGKRNARVTVPMTVGNTTGRSIIAFDATITYDATVLRATGVTAAGLSQGWTVIANLNIPGQIKIAAFNATALSGSGTLLNLAFTVAGTACAESALTVASFVFNEGEPAATTTNGAFRVTPCSSPTPTPTVTPTPTPMAPGTQLYLSSSANGRIGNLAFSDEDILHFDPATASWLLYFDGSDVGIGNVDVDAFDLQADDSILLSFDKPLRMTIAQQPVTIDDADLVRFIPTQLGPTTSGSFARFFTGATIGLTTAGENIDAVDVDAAGRLILSTGGAFTVGALRGDDEDLLVVDTNNLATLLFDGSDVALTAGSEDLSAVWMDGTELYLATKGAFNVRGSVNTVSGSAQDIFICHLLSSGTTTDCRFTLFFTGRAVGLTAPIDGIHVVRNLAVSRLFRPAAGNGESMDAAAQFAIVAETASDTTDQADPELDAFDQPTTDEEAPAFQLYMPLIITQ